jgi:hypothetical protein
MFVQDGTLTSNLRGAFLLTAKDLQATYIGRRIATISAKWGSNTLELVSGWLETAGTDGSCQEVQ